MRMMTADTVRVLIRIHYLNAAMFPAAYIIRNITMAFSALINTEKFTCFPGNQSGIGMEGVRDNISVTARA